MSLSIFYTAYWSNVVQSLGVSKNVCVARVCGHNHPDCDSVSRWRQQAGTIAMWQKEPFVWVWVWQESRTGSLFDRKRFSPIVWVVPCSGYLFRGKVVLQWRVRKIDVHYRFLSALVCRLDKYNPGGYMFQFTHFIVVKKSLFKKLLKNLQQFLCSNQLLIVG